MVGLAIPRAVAGVRVGAVRICAIPTACAQRVKAGFRVFLAGIALRFRAGVAGVNTFTISVAGVACAVAINAVVTVAVAGFEGPGIGHDGHITIEAAVGGQFLIVGVARAINQTAPGLQRMSALSVRPADVRGAVQAVVRAGAPSMFVHAVRLLDVSQATQPSASWLTPSATQTPPIKQPVVIVSTVHVPFTQCRLCRHSQVAGVGVVVDMPAGVVATNLVRAGGSVVGQVRAAEGVRAINADPAHALVLVVRSATCSDGCVVKGANVIHTADPLRASPRSLSVSKIRAARGVHAV
jgi:hypothetical protein